MSIGKKLIDRLKEFADAPADRTYRVSRYCPNCGHRFVEHIEKGRIAGKRALCPNCKNVTAEQDGWDKK